MKKNVKKIISCTLVFLMSVSILIGCGDRKNVESNSKETGQSVSKSEVKDEVSKETPVELEPVTLTIHLPGSEGTGTKDVMEVFNEKLAELLPNTTVEIKFHGSYSDYAATWPMIIAGKEKMDIAWAGWVTPYLDDVKDGTFLGLSEMINESTPNLLAELETYPVQFNSCTYEGEIYGVPCIQPLSFESRGLLIGEGMEKYFDMEALINEFRNSPKLTEKTLDIIEEAVKAAIDDNAIKVGDLSWNIPTDAFNMSIMGYVGLTNDMYLDPEQEEPVILHQWEIPESQMLYKRLAKWYDWGWITETQVAGQLPEGSVKLFRFNDATNQSWANADDRGVIYNVESSGQKYTEILTNRPTEYYRGLSTFGEYASYLAIPYYAENPERAMMLIDILRGEIGTPGNDLVNLLCYGFEENSPEAKKYGWCNYTAIEKEGQLEVDTTIRGEAEAKHSITNWVVTNTCKTIHDGHELTTAKGRAYVSKYWDEIYPNTKTTVVDGMMYDKTAFADEIADMKNVYNKYKNQIRNGCGGQDKVQEVLDSAITEIYDCGFEEIKADYLNQIATYSTK